MSLMWIPAHTTVPSRSRTLSACGTSSPADAQVIRSDLVFPIEVVVRERRDVAHVDPGAYDGAVAVEDLERLWHELAGRGEDDRGVEELGGPFVRSPGPH